MKKFECIIRPSKLEVVREALSSVGVRKITVSEIRRFERSREYNGFYIGSGQLIDFASKLKIETLVEEENVDKVVKAVQQVTSIQT